MSIRIGANPIGWTNDDLQEVGGDTPLETCLAQAKEAGVVGMEKGHKLPNDGAALSHGMRSLAIMAARAINRVLGRKGRVFAYRYHATAISSPRQMRNALSYVLNNWRRHDEDESSEAAHRASLDPYSTAVHFRGWREGVFAVPAGFEPLPSAAPESTSCSHALGSSGCSFNTRCRASKASFCRPASESARA